MIPALGSLLPEAKLQELRGRAKDSGTSSLWELILAGKVLPEDTVLERVSERFKMPIADLTKIDRNVITLVPEQLARRFNVIPLRATDSWLDVATANPFDMDAEKMLAFATGREVRLLVCSPSRIREKLDEVYRPDDLVERLLDGIADNTEITQLADETEDLAANAQEARARPIIKLVDTLLADSINSRASDLHVEPVEGGVIVRYRIDGVLREIMKIPRSAGVPLISRIKIMAGMDIADRLRPQDGRCRVAVNGNPVDLRVSTLPASLGEKVVIRILNAQATVLSLESLGFTPRDRETIQQLISYKEGIVLVTGPTGSGKTTTLYAALREVMKTGVNIVTVEDPVEYRLGQSIVQVQVNEKAGLTFAASLRSILRQDPDVVLIGEVRDQETAQIAVQASLTGHLVLSTLHTNDAPNTLTRLVDIGLEPYKIASALRGVVAQRLMRRLCQNCKEVETNPVPRELTPFVPSGVTLYRPKGCGECAQTGYRGRFGIVELLVMNPELARLVSSGATADQLATSARTNGMRSLFESGLESVLAGQTSLDELLRVTDPPKTKSGQQSAPPADRSKPADRSRSSGGWHATAREPDDGAGDHLTTFELIEDAELPPSRVEVTRKGAVVLLVDDEDSLRRVMRDLLEQQGYSVAEAADGASALSQIDRVNPDLVLLDLNLPGVDGYTVLSAIRSREATRNLPVIVLTAKSDEDNEVKVLGLGADDFLTKPFRARALAARIELNLTRRRSA